MNAQEIKSKYGYDSGMEVKVDIEAMRESAKGSLREAESMVVNQKDREKRKAAGMGGFEDTDWNRRWKKRNADGIKEQRRSVELAKKMLDEVSAILDKAEAKLAEVK